MSEQPPFEMNIHAAETRKVRPSLARPRLPLDMGPAASGLARFYIQQIRRNCEMGLAAIEILMGDDLLGISDTFLGAADEWGYHFEEIIAGCQRAINPPDEDDDDQADTETYEEGGEQ